MSRIVAVADAFHTLTTDRPYRPRFTVRDVQSGAADRRGWQKTTRPRSNRTASATAARGRLRCHEIGTDLSYNRVVISRRGNGRPTTATRTGRDMAAAVVLIRIGGYTCGRRR